MADEAPARKVARLKTLANYREELFARGLTDPDVVERTAEELYASFNAGIGLQNLIPADPAPTTALELRRKISPMLADPARLGAARGVLTKYMEMRSGRKSFEPDICIVDGVQYLKGTVVCFNVKNVEVGNVWCGYIPYPHHKYYVADDGGYTFHIEFATYAEALLVYKHGVKAGDAKLTIERLEHTPKPFKAESGKVLRLTGIPPSLSGTAMKELVVPTFLPTKYLPQDDMTIVVELDTKRDANEFASVFNGYKLYGCILGVSSMEDE